MSLALVLAVFVAGAAQLSAQTVPPGGKEQVDKFIAVLQSDAPLKEKVDACRGLGVIGTKEAVPALAALLGDEKLSHNARYALEPIPDPSVDDALRDALGKLKGRPLAGVIVSIGARRDAKAVVPLWKMLLNPDADMVQAAARSLGSIGTPEAAKAIQSALPNAPAANRPALCEGLLRAAEALAAKGQRDEAIVIYDRLRSLEPAPHQVRAAALRGAILARGKDGLALLRDHLGSKDYLLFAAAVRTSQEMPGAEVTQSLCAGLGRLPADNQILVMQTLGKRGDRAALPALVAAARSGAKPVRLSAVRALGEIGDASAAAALIDLQGDADRELAQASQESMAVLEGKQIDAAVMAMLAGTATARRLTALDLIGQRRIKAAVPALLKAAGDPDAEIRRAALKRLGELGSPAELPALVDLLMALKEPQDLSAAEQAVGALCARADNPEACTQKLIERLAPAPGAQKAALLRVLGAAGGAGALKAVRESLKDPDAQVRAAAIRTLAAWKTADVVPDLLALARRSSIPAERALGLRGYLAWAARAELPVDHRLSICRQAGELAQTTEEKKLLLAALGSIASADALALVVPQLDDVSVKDEACAAAVSVAERLLKGKGGDTAQTASKLVEPLKKVAQAATDADLAQRAKAALKRAQGRSSRK
jgi:HEAT repeat protein